MAQTRTTQQWLRAYVDGYDVSGYARQVGEMGGEAQASEDAALTDGVKNVLVGQSEIGLDTINVFLDPVTAGPHAALKTTDVNRIVMVPIGMGAAPALGNPVFAAELNHVGFKALVENNYAVEHLKFGKTRVGAAELNYPQCWGKLLLPKTTLASPTVNSATGLDDYGAATAKGGFAVFMLFSSNGTVTLKAQDAAVNADGSFADITGLTSGSIDATTTPVASVVALATSANVRRYLRYQVAWGTATSAVAAVAFVRALF